MSTPMTDHAAPTPIPEAATLTIPWPKVAPLGYRATPEGLKEAWDAIIPSLDQSIEVRVLMGVLRAVYDGMHGFTPTTPNQEQPS